MLVRIIIVWGNRTLAAAVQGVRAVSSAGAVAGALRRSLWLARPDISAPASAGSRANHIDEIPELAPMIAKAQAKA